MRKFYINLMDAHKNILGKVPLIPQWLAYTHSMPKMRYYGDTNRLTKLAT